MRKTAILSACALLVVITSYIIHYTKLYDAEQLRLVPLGSRQRTDLQQRLRAHAHHLCLSLRRPAAGGGGRVAPEPAPKRAAPQPVTIPEPPEPGPPVVDISHLRGFTTEDIESFKALGVEVCLHVITSYSIHYTKLYETLPVGTL